MTIEEIANNFTYHAPKDDQTKRYEEIRAKGLLFALEVFGSCPESREKSLAMTKIDEAVMWANASIARNEDG